MTSPIGGSLVFATVPAGDLDRAKAWYRDKLGLSPIRDEPTGVWYEVANGRFIVYPSGYAGTAQSTAIGFHSTTSRRPSPSCAGEASSSKTTTFRASRRRAGSRRWADYLAAWCRDSEGNIIMIAQPPPEQTGRFRRCG